VALGVVSPALIIAKSVEDQLRVPPARCEKST
jgi:hypothetical protein